MSYFEPVFDLRSLPYEGKIDTGKFLGMMSNSINRFLEEHKRTGRMLLNIIDPVQYKLGE